MRGYYALPVPPPYPPFANATAFLANRAQLDEMKKDLAEAESVAGKHKEKEERLKQEKEELLAEIANEKAFIAKAQKTNEADLVKAKCECSYRTRSCASTSDLLFSPT